MNSMLSYAPPLLGAALLALVLPRARRATVMYGWIWACVALAATSLLQIYEGAAGGAAPSWLPAARFAALSLTFCPFMSVLGSKRPHEQAWQWIVLSLWGVLVLPAAEWWVLRRGVTLEIHGVRAWFLLILIGMQALHGLGTRLWLAGLLLAAAQASVFAADLPVVGTWLDSSLRSVLGESLRRGGEWLCGLSALAATWHAWRPRAAASPRDRIWCDFRDRFGLLWAVRVWERVQAATATEREPTRRLGWYGFVVEAEETDESQLDQVVWNLLRRFVSRSWCVERGWTPPQGGEE
ncbi:MAG: hypothetical protein U0939_11400 [Pirellulales bacterium]